MTSASSLRIDLLAVLVDVELRDAANLELEEALYVVIGDDLAAQLLHVRHEAGAHGVPDALHRFLLLDALVDALLNEDAVKRTRVIEVVQLSKAYLLLALRQLRKPLDVPLQDIRHAHEPRTPLVKNDRTRRYRLLAVRERVERDNRLLLAFAGLKLQLYPDRVAREVVKLPHRHLLLLYGVLDGLRNGVRRFAPRQLGDDELTLVLLLDLGTHPNLTQAVLVFRDVHYSAELEVGVERERLLLENAYLGFKELDEVMRQDCRR